MITNDDIIKIMMPFKVQHPEMQFGIAGSYACNEALISFQRKLIQHEFPEQRK